MNSPLVTVICLCFNHERFVREAMESVVRQSYRPVQLIVVDDASTDQSKNVISDFLKNHPDAIFIQLEQNIGNCAAFNMGLKQAKGEFVVDLAADDVLHVNRLEVGIREFFLRDAGYGVQFADAELIDEMGNHVGFHSDRFDHRTVPQGNVYEALIRKYFICGPSMLVRKEVFDKLKGYDEALAFEDFDFWIRSSRDYKYFYLPQVLVKRRLVRGSMSENQFKRGNVQHLSTFQVCGKILTLNRSRSEQRALGDRIRYEFLYSLWLFDFRMAWKYVLLWRKNKSYGPEM